MEPGGTPLLDAALQVVRRYGMKRTTMIDLSKATGVSRQSLYDRFGDKDGLMAAIIESIGLRVCDALRQELHAAPDLGSSLDAYFRIAIWPTYEIVQSMPDAADLERGMGPRSVEATKKVADDKRSLLAALFQNHLPPHAPPPEQIALFFEQSSCQAKMSDISPEDLAQYLSVLKEAALALVRNP